MFVVKGETELGKTAMDFESAMQTFAEAWAAAAANAKSNEGSASAVATPAPSASAIADNNNVVTDAKSGVVDVAGDDNEAMDLKVSLLALMLC